MAKGSTNSEIQKKNPSLEEAVVELKKDTNASLSPLAYGTINKSVEGNLDSLQSELIFQKKLQNFDKLVQTKARKTWLEKFGNKVTSIGPEMRADFGQVVAGDPEVDLAFKDMVSFDKTNATVSGAILAAGYLSGKTTQRWRNADTNGKGFAGKSLAALKPVLITNLALQPAVLGAVGALGKTVGKGAYHGVGVVKNTLYGTISGDLWKETTRIGKGGNPAEYLWNGKTYKQRKFDMLKNPEIYKTPQKLKEYFDPQLRNTFNAIEDYPKNPKNIEKHITPSAEFVFRSAQCSMNPVQLQAFIVNMEAGVWNEPMVRKAMMTSASGGILKFFLETASAQHRKSFMAEFKKLSHQKFPPRPFTDKDLQARFPKVCKKCTKKEKKGIRAALSLGGSGLAAGVFMLTALLSKILFKFGKNTFDLSDPGNGGWDRFGERMKGGFVKKKDDFKKFQEYESKRFKGFLKKRKAKESLAMLGGRKGILTDTEIDNFTGKKLNNIERNKIMDDLHEFMGDEKRKITTEEFWELSSVKKLRGKNLRERKS